MKQTIAANAGNWEKQSREIKAKVDQKSIYEFNWIKLFIWIVLHILVETVNQNIYTIIIYHIAPLMLYLWACNKPDRTVIWHYFLPKTCSRDVKREKEQLVSAIKFPDIERSSELPFSAGVGGSICSVPPSQITQITLSYDAPGGRGENIFLDTVYTWFFFVKHAISPPLPLPGIWCIFC